MRFNGTSTINIFIVYVQIFPFLLYLKSILFRNFNAPNEFNPPTNLNMKQLLTLCAFRKNLLEETIPETANMGLNSFFENIPVGVFSRLT